MSPERKDPPARRVPQRERRPRRLAAVVLAAVVLAAAVVTGLVSCVDSGPPATQRMILITIDTLRADHLSCYGYQRITSPNLDRLAQSEATLFADAHSSAPWTLPSVTSILTSLHPPQHRVIDEAHRLTSEVPTLAATLYAEGWLTAGVVSHIFASRRFGLDHGFLEFDEILPAAGSPEDYIHAGIILGKVRSWIAHHSEQRFFLFIHLFDPHFDYAPPAPFDRQFVDPNYSGDADGSWRYVAPYAAPDRRLASEDLAQVVALYDGEIRWIDDQLGELFGFLKEMDLWDDTALVISADHGEEFQEHGSIHHTRTLYEEVLHVPLLVKLPGGRRAHDRPVVDERVRNLDIAPTLLELAGVAPPSTFEGASLLPLVRQRGRDRPVFAHTFRYGSDKAALIVGDQKLIHDLGDGTDMRFDLDADAAEQRPLAGGPDDLRRTLVSELERMSRFAAVPESVELSERERRRLEALGYVE